MAASEKASAELKTAVANFLASKDDTKKNAADVAALIPESRKGSKRRLSACTGSSCKERLPR